MKFKVNDYVVVKKSIKKIDGESVENYGGKITEIDEDGLITVELDSFSLKSYTDKTLEFIYNEGFDPLTYIFGEDDLVKIKPRDTQEDVKNAQMEVLQRLATIESDDDDDDNPEDDNRFKVLNETIDEWTDKFIESKYYQTLTELQQNYTGFITKTFSECLLNYYNIYPSDWKAAKVKSCILKEIPGNVSAEKELFECYIPVLMQFFKFLDAEKLLNTKELQETIKDLSGELIKKAKNSKNWGSAKTFLMDAVNQGININDETAMFDFIDNYNKKLEK